MTDDGFGIVETSGVVLFIGSDLKEARSKASRVFGSPAFAGTGAAGGAFKISTIEVWSFAAPGSDAIEQLSPRKSAKHAITPTALQGSKEAP